MWKVDGFEGDDLIATATKQLTEIVTPAMEPVHRVLIASADKDLLALVSDRASVLSTRTNKTLGPADVKEKLGVEPCQVVDYLTLMGDTSDNIKGATGIGPKTAAGLLCLFGNIDDMYGSIDEGTAALKPAQLASLEELRPRLSAVRELVTMRTDVPLDVAQVFNERVPKVAERSMIEEDEMDEDQDPIVGPTGTPTGTIPIPERVLGQDFPRPQPKLDEDQPPPKPEPTELVKVVASEPEEWGQRLEPRTMNDAIRLAERMHLSHMFSGTGYGNGPAVLSTILLGRELGIPAMAALRSVHLIEGKHSLSADLMVALVLKSGMAEYFQMVESTDAICTFETSRNGAPQPTRLSYTIADAEKAGIARKGGNWQKMPKQMLRARAKSELARLEYPDLLAGLYTPEELGDDKGGVS